MGTEDRACGHAFGARRFAPGSDCPGWMVISARMAPSFPDRAEGAGALVRDLGKSVDCFGGAVDQQAKVKPDQGGKAFEI
jgi:hypothetical protein